MLNATKVADERKEEECAICLEVMGNKKTLLLCSHSFCVNCIINFIKSKNSKQIDCPTCRQKCTFLTIKSEDESAETGATKEQRDFLRKYNDHIFEYEGFITKLENIPFIFHRFISEIILTGGISLICNYRFYIGLLLLYEICGDNYFEYGRGNNLFPNSILNVFDYIDSIFLLGFVVFTLI